jgi:CheY-like chemotaxis protein
MQDVRADRMVPRVLVFETSEERASLITERLTDHGIEAHFVESVDEIIRALREKPSHVVMLNDCLSSPEELLGVAKEIRREFTALPEIILSTDNSRLNLQDCHAMGCSQVLKRAIDFNELCDIIERVAQVSGKRLYDGKQLRHINRFGKSTSSGKDLSLKVHEIARGGFYFEVDPMNPFKPNEGMLLGFDIRLTMFPDYSFQGKGYVSWVRRMPDGKLGVGVEFTNIPQDSEMLLKAFSDLFKIREFLPAPRPDIAA